MTSSDVRKRRKSLAGDAQILYGGGGMNAGDVFFRILTGEGCLSLSAPRQPCFGRRILGGFYVSACRVGTLRSGSEPQRPMAILSVRCGRMNGTAGSPAGESGGSQGCWLVSSHGGSAYSSGEMVLRRFLCGRDDGEFVRKPGTCHARRKWAALSGGERKTGFSARPLKGARRSSVGRRS